MGDKSPKSNSKAKKQKASKKDHLAQQQAQLSDLKPKVG